MTTPVNLQRDGIFLVPGTTNRLEWGAATLIETDPAIATLYASVVYDYGHVTGNHKTANSTNKGQYRAMGLAIAPPNGDRQPYRIKAAAATPAEAAASPFLIIGYTDSATTPTLGTDAPISVAAIIPFFSVFDEEVILEENPVGFEDRPLVFALAYAVTENLTGTRITGHLSVQNLGVKPPTMQNAVS